MQTLAKRLPVFINMLQLLSGGVRQRNVTRENRTFFVAFMDE
jgi:hypothetical protein